VFNSKPKEEIMLLRYNDGEKTVLMTIDEKALPEFKVDQVDFISDINEWDIRAALYMLDGETIFIADIIDITTCEDEPELVEIKL
jgi:hypothetical protein